VVFAVIQAQSIRLLLTSEDETVDPHWVSTTGSNVQFLQLLFYVAHSILETWLKEGTRYLDYVLVGEGEWTFVK
jgi:hypothetical protein